MVCAPFDEPGCDGSARDICRREIGSATKGRISRENPVDLIADRIDRYFEERKKLKRKNRPRCSISARFSETWNKPK
jgi:hypothetical protein